MATSLHGRSRFVAEINVTPFVDVMLVLLIIFMVTALLMTEGLDVSLFWTQTAKSLPTDKDHVIVTMKQDGTIYVDTILIRDMENFTLMMHSVASAQKRQVFLQADKDVPYGRVADIMARLTAAGIDKMGMITERIDPQDAAGTAKGR